MSGEAATPPKLVPFTPEDDDKERLQCPECKRVVYSNPLPVGGVVVGDSCPETGKRRVLLVRRAIEPSIGMWTIPGGYLECGESVKDGSVREAAEEALTDVEATSLLAVYSVPHADHIMIWFRARFSQPAPEPGSGPDTRFGAGHETSEARLFPEEAIPWDELAFPTTKYAVRDYLADPDGESVTYRTVTKRLRA